MKPSVEIDTKELEKNLKRLAKKFDQAVVEGAIAGGNLVRSAAIESIQEVSVGYYDIRYRAGGGQYEHTTSAEGDAPNTDTGRLVQSIQVEITKKAVFVGSTLEYASYLEFGTRSMVARPWLFPAVESNRIEIEKLIKKELDIESQKAGDL